MIWVGLAVFIFYGVIILIFTFKNWKFPAFDNTSKQHTHSFTVIIPFRNEEAHLKQLLQSLATISYPKHLWEVLLVDDNSTDFSVDIITAQIEKHGLSNASIINNERTSASPKKDAIQIAITNSQYDWIVTTDADCVVKSSWLSTLDAFIQKQLPYMVVMPVAIATTPKQSFLRAYEQLDFMSLMGVTAGSFRMGLPFLCNGANLAYKKSAFNEVSGFTSNNQIASGDDHFLLEKFVSAFSKKVAYLRSQDVIVTTQAIENWQSFISQRTRWAAKSTGYSFWFAKVMGLLALYINFLSALILLSIPIHLHWYGEGIWGFFAPEINSGQVFAKAGTAIILLGFLILKFSVDYLLITTEARFYKRRQFMKWYPAVMFCYPFLSTFIALKAITGGFEWKGRAYKR